MKLRRPKPQTRRLPGREPLLTVETQAALDRAADSPDGVLILGGTPDRPLIVRERFRVRPVIGDGACVLLRAADSRSRSHPPDALVAGDGANVLAMGRAFVECRGESIVRLKGKAKARMYKGRLVAGGQSRGCLYGTATGILWGWARCVLKNDASVQCFEQSRAILCHTSKAELHGRRTSAWQKGRRPPVTWADKGMPA